MKQQSAKPVSHLSYTLGQVFAMPVLVALLFALQWMILVDTPNQRSEALGYSILGLVLLFVPAAFYGLLVAWIIKKIDLRRDAYGQVAAVIMNNFLFIVSLFVFVGITGDSPEDAQGLILYFLVPVSVAAAILSFLLPKP